MNRPLKITGTYENSSEHAYFGGEGSGYEAPTLAQVLGVYSSGLGVTHVKTESAPENKLKISAFDIMHGTELQVGEKYLDLADSFYHEGRWTNATTTTHFGFDGGEQENFDPLFMLTMPIATLGVGTLLTPLSEWWRFSFAAADEGSLAIRRQKLSSAMLILVVYSRHVVFFPSWETLSQDSKQSAAMVTKRTLNTSGLRLLS